MYTGDAGMHKDKIKEEKNECKKFKQNWINWKGWKWPGSKGAKRKKVANIRLATHEGYYDSEKNWVDKDVWHEVVFWDGMAEKTQKIEKGDLIYVSGRLTYKEKETAITADDVILLAKKSK